MTYYDICNYVGCVSPDNIVLGNGSMELIYRFAEALITGGEALIPVLSFMEYERVSLLVSARPKLVSMQPDFSLDINSLRRMSTMKLVCCLYATRTVPLGSSLTAT
jgi:histidinol-phosphate/aromatic aminotransferase/cobyric acid decarboxylase-like protein